ncbi:MAG TPA: hypothetical protein VGG60_11080 [Candidatus Binataceae bacterium]|jgi:hypothetical protein
MLIGTMIQNAKWILLVLLIAAAVAYRAVLVHQRDSARTQVTTLTAAAAVLQADNASMAAAVARQNAAIDTLQAKMKVAQSAAATRQTRYANSAATAMTQERTHANAMMTAPIASGCADAIAWGNAQGPELGRW